MDSFEQKRRLRPIIGLAFLFGAFVPPVPTPIGIGPGFHLAAATPTVRESAPVGRFPCLAQRRPPTLAHVELFARRRVLLLPQGIGMSRRCTYAVRTTSPTGVVAFDTRVRPTSAISLRSGENRCPLRDWLGFAVLCAPSSAAGPGAATRGRSH